MLPLLPDFAPRRLHAQEACFTFHPIGGGAIDKEAIATFPVPAELKKGIREHLRLTGIDEGAVFPDLDGKVRAIRQEFGYLVGA